MTAIPKELFDQLKKVSDKVKNDLRRKGLVVPVKNEDGTITLGNFTIIRDQQGFYSVLDQNKESVVTGINLPHTAIILTNTLALGKIKDRDLLIQDQHYGYADFEEHLYRRALARDTGDKFGLYLSKYSTAKTKKTSCKKYIIKSFENLIKFA